MNNGQVANIFEEIADLLDLSEANPFRIRAYRNAARTIRSYPEELAGLAKNPDTKLSDIRGIGKDLDEKIHVLFDTGTLPLLEQLRNKFPVQIRNLLRVPGLGPKKVQRLYKELGLESIDDLKAAINDHRIENIKGFGPKTSAKLLTGIELLQKNSNRILISDAKVIASGLLEHVNKTHGLKHIVIAGSYRRRKETVGDLDLLAVCSNSQDLMNQLTTFESLAVVEARGPKRMTIRLKDGFQIDLRIVPEKSWGSALVYFTGSKSHNIELRQRAMDLGLKLNEYGVFSGDRYIAGATEEDVYRALSLAWIPPELRESSTIINLAEKNKIPPLVEVPDILGDLHVHSNVTDGRDTIVEMVVAAIERNYKYLSFTDHSKRVSMAKGLDAIRIQKYWAEIDRIQTEYPSIKLLRGVELDILENGDLDLPDSTLEKADWVIAAIHYGQNQSRRKITEQLINAIKNRNVNAIAHASGRLIGERPGYDADFNEVFKAAADYGCAIEINGQPNRLDINDSLLELANKYSVAFVLNSDAHSTSELDYMEYAVDQARRGSINKQRIINTNSWTEFIGKSKQKKFKCSKNSPTSRKLAT